MINYFLFFVVLFFMAIAFSFFLSPFLGAPPVPSTKNARDAIADAIEKNDKSIGNIVDIGSGFGHMVFCMAKRFPDRQIIGCEISPVPYFCSIIWQKVFGYKNTKFVFGDGFKKLEKDEIKASSVVFYLCPALTKKADKVLPKIENLVIANNFPIPNKKEKECIKVGEWANSIIYIYDCSSSN